MRQRKGPVVNRITNNGKFILYRIPDENHLLSTAEEKSCTLQCPIVRCTQFLTTSTSQFRVGQQALCHSSLSFVSVEKKIFTHINSIWLEYLPSGPYVVLLKAFLFIMTFALSTLLVNNCSIIHSFI